jgi:indolepyruvate ferredoxin oxidoreductase
LLGADLIVAAGKEPLAMLSPNRSAVIVNTHEEMPSDFIRDRDFEFPGRRLVAALRAAGRSGSVSTLDATRLAAALLGDSIGANVLMLGFAFQRGLLPVTGAALYRALELYGRNVEENKLAFDWGRFAAESLVEVERLAREGVQAVSTSLPEAIARREEFLVGYQNRAYAERYRARLARIAAVEQRVRPGSTALQDAVARNYFTVLAYKDEYEVARLHTESGFIESVKRSFGESARMSFHFSPPLFARRDPATGRPKKYELGPWVLPLLRVLAKLRWLRGKKLDPFGMSADRRLERELLARYEATLDRIADEVDGSRFDLSVELAKLPEQVRGYGPIKSAAAARAREAEEKLWRQWVAPAVAETRARASAA